MRNWGLLIWLLVGSVYGQEVESSYSVELNGLIASDSANPFWMSHNNYFQIGNETTFAGNLSANFHYSLSDKASINAGTWIYYRDAVRADNLQRRDLFVNFTNRWLRATLGSKSAHDPSEGLSVSAKNFLFSGNARPLPGILLEANEPIKVWNGATVDWGIGHYVLNDERYVSDTYVHYKRLGLQWQWNERNGITARIQHFAQWGGTSPEYGKIENDFGDLVDIFFASKPEGNPIANEALNALGNHLGTYYVEFQTQQEWGWLSVYHDHPFEDGSGTALKNFPHGIWGLHFKPANNAILSAILYEFVDTKSKTTGYFDNYFSNGIYRSGWTYEGNTIGLPFILSDPDIVLGPDTRAIISNKVSAHHVGVQGKIKQWHWMLKSSLVSQWIERPSIAAFELNSWFNYAQVERSIEGWGLMRLTVGFDTDTTNEDRWGLGLTYRYTID